MMDPDLEAIRARARVGTDISSHLESIFRTAVRLGPRLIVELGVGPGESTFVLERVARRSGATLVSVDITDCSSACRYDKWFFVQQDDVAFGHRFREWCDDRGILGGVDILFVDTCHLYEHTKEEIRTWFPHLAARAIVFLHDTNLRRFYRRRDHTIGRAWDNRRGVIRALETYFDRDFQEQRSFQRQIGSWRITHDPICNGLTTLIRTPAVKARVRPMARLSRLGLFVRRRFLRADECSAIRREMTRSISRAAEVVRRDGQVIDERVRKTETTTVSGATSSMLGRRLDRLRPALGRHFGLTLWGCQSPQFLRYPRDSFFAAHPDNDGDPRLPPNVVRRRLSAVVFLNTAIDGRARRARETRGDETFHGGGLLVFHDLPDGPRGGTSSAALAGVAGLLVVFPAAVVHEVTSVEWGTRCSVVTWFY